MISKNFVSSDHTKYLLNNKKSKDHTPREPAPSCNVLDLDGIGRHGFTLQAAPDHDSPEKGCD